jgi:hypothetical protein
MKDLNLIRKVAWSFHRTTRIDFDELVQEAALAYYASSQRYDKSKGSYSTFIWWAITNHLKNFVKKEKRFYFPLQSIEDDLPIHSYHSELYALLSKDASIILSVISRDPKHFTISQRTGQVKIIRRMKCYGWDIGKTWVAIRDLHFALAMLN